MLYIVMFLLYLTMRNDADILDESYRVELRLYDEELESKFQAIENLEEELDTLKEFVKRLSIASGYTEDRICDIEENKSLEEFFDEDENTIEDEEEIEQENIVYKVNEGDSWEEIIWKWADAYDVPAKTIPRNKADLLNLTSLSLAPSSVHPDAGMSDFVHLTYSNDSIIDKIPNELFNLRNLMELDLSNTNIDTLSSEVANLKNLKILILINTQIKKLPKEIVELRKLEYLNIEGTKIEEIPAGLKNIPNIKIFKGG